MLWYKIRPWNRSVQRLQLSFWRLSHHLLSFSYFLLIWITLTFLHVLSPSASDLEYGFSHYYCHYSYCNFLFWRDLCVIIVVVAVVLVAATTVTVVVVVVVVVAVVVFIAVVVAVTFNSNLWCCLLRHLTPGNTDLFCFLNGHEVFVVVVTFYNNLFSSFLYFDIWENDFFSGPWR